jgi:hypothetical protein
VIILDSVKIAYEKGYRANDDGSINGLYTAKLRLGKGSNGYLLFRIRVGESLRTVPAHRFAAYCFFGEELYKHECVRHINGDKTDNSKSNLLLGSLADNYNDNSKDWRIDFANKGAATKRKLSDTDVIEIRRMLTNGESYRNISDKFRVAKSTIQQIKEGKSYKWVI